MTEFAGRVRHGFKQGSSEFLLMLLRVLTGSFLGVAVGLITQEVLAQPQELTLAFIFAFVTAFAVVWRLTRGWGLAAILLFDLIAVLVGVLLRLYIMVAPN